MTDNNSEYPFYTITLIPYQEQHCQTLFDIRNEQGVRNGMLNKQILNWESHVSWTKKNIIDERNVHVFLVKSKDKIAGFSLLKKLPENAFELGVILKEEFTKTRVAFLAAIATGKYCFEQLGGDALFSNVPKSNQTALDFNQRMGLEIYKTDADYFYLKADKSIYRHRLVAPQLKRKNHPTD
jgi:hypothetical protein